MRDFFFFALFASPELFVKIKTVKFLLCTSKANTPHSIRPTWNYLAAKRSMSASVPLTLTAGMQLWIHIRVKLFTRHFHPLPYLTPPTRIGLGTKLMNADEHRRTQTHGKEWDAQKQMQTHGNECRCTETKERQTASGVGGTQPQHVQTLQICSKTFWMHYTYMYI